MTSLFLVLLILCSLNQATSIGGGSFEGKRSPNKRNIQCGIRWRGTCGFRRLRKSISVFDTENSSFDSGDIPKKNQNKLNYLRKLCKTIIKNSNENEGFGIVKACKKNLPL